MAVELITRVASAAGTGDVVGPSSSVNDRIAVFDGTTGKLLKDGGSSIADIVAGSGGLVTSVFGRTGAIVAATNDYTFAQINKATSSLADITTRSAGDLSSGTLLAARMPALSGDVVTNVGTIATSISDNVVTLAKMADIATASFLGRNTAGTGDPEVLSIATSKTMLSLTGTNSGDVTLAGQNYLSIAGQVITANAVHLGSTNVTGTLTVDKGGTGLASYAVGDLIYASAATTLSKLAGVATGNALISGGVTTAPLWGKIGLTTHISGTLAVANGGTGAVSFTANGVLYGNTTSPIQVTAQGGANTVLTANAGAPSFSAAPVIGTSVTVPLITTLSSGNLTIAPTGSVTFDPTGNQIDPLTNYDLNLGQLSKKYLTLHAAELWVETLVAQDTAATIGGRVLIGPTTVLTSDLAAAATSIIVKHNQMINGDRVYMESNGKVEFLAITSAPSGTGPYTYTVTRNLDGTGANDWFAGDAVFNTGQTGNGFIDLYSVRGVKTSSQAGPTIVGNVRNSATFNDWSERWAIGNLNGLYGYGTTTYGVAMGVPSAAWVKIDPTNGVRIGHNTTTLTQIDASGNASFTGSITASSGTIGGWTINTNSITKNEVKISAGAAPALSPTVAEVWFGKETGGQSGLFVKGTTAAFLSIGSNPVVGSASRPYIIMHDGTNTRVGLGELNYAWGSDGATNSMGMKIWDASGNLLVHFSDLANTIAGLTITSTRASVGSGATTAGLDSTVTGGDDVRIFAGSSTPSSAPFRVTEAGALTATNATITGAITATSGSFTGSITSTSGTIGGWTLSSTALTSVSSNVVLDSATTGGITLSTITSGGKGSMAQSQKVKWAVGGSPIGDLSAYRLSSSGRNTTEVSSYGLTAGERADIRIAAYITDGGSAAEDAVLTVTSDDPNNKGYITLTGNASFQGVTIGSPLAPTASAILDLSSTTGAFLPPRMTTTQRDALTATDGMHIYNTTLATAQYRKAGAWVSY